MKVKDYFMDDIADPKNPEPDYEQYMKRERRLIMIDAVCIGGLIGFALGIILFSAIVLFFNYT